MEVFPLDQGDPAWVFGDNYETEPVHRLLAEAADQMIALACAVHGQASWAGAGLEFHRLPGGPWHGPRTKLAGSVAVSDGISFEVDLSPAEGAFEVDAEIAVRCDAQVDCGMHTVLALPSRQATDAKHAADELLAATRWLYHQGLAQSTLHWREQDPRAGHA